MSGNTNIQLNAVPNEPTMADLLNLLKKEIFFDLNCHHIATIQSFDASKQTATATVNYTKTIFELDETTGLYEPIQVSYPLMVDMPVITMGGGTARLTMPIAKGDQCLILFNDRNIDNWFQSGQVGPVANSQAHAFSDGFVLVGPNSLNSLISGYDAVRAIISNGTVKIGINPTNNKLVLTNGTSLSTLLQNLCTQLKSLTDLFGSTFAANLVLVTGSPGAPSPINPSLASQISTVGTNINNIKTQVAGLIE